MFFLNGLLRILDSFLPPDQRESAECRMRGRMIVLLFLTTASLNVAGTIFNRLLSFQEAVSYLVFSGLAASCLVLIKLVYPPEKVLTGFLSLCLFMPVFSLSTPDFPVFYLLYIYIIALALIFLLVTSLRTRLFFLVVAAVAQLLCFLILSDRISDGSVVFSHHSIEGSLSTVVANVISIFIFIAVILRIKTIAQNELQQEVDWQQRSIRLGELASMTTTMRLLLEKPVLSFKNKIETMAQGRDPSVLQKMQEELDELLLISQSFGWIYRAYRGEENSLIGSTTLIRQLHILLSTRCKEEGWSLTLKQVGHPVEIYGPIPSIMLLLFTVVAQIVKESQPFEKKLLAVEIDHKEALISCKVSWPSDAYDLNSDSHSSAEGFSGLVQKQELIQELKQACKADVRHSREQGAHQLLILGPWRRLEAIGI